MREKRKCKYYHYFVEGEDEEKIVKTLKTDLQMIAPGKIQKFNVIQEKLTKYRLLTLKKGTIVVLVFDTDTGNISTLLENIEFLKKENTVKEVLCITQVKNLEDELIRSCDIRQIRELTGSKSNKDFKRDVIRDNSLHKKLLKHKFDFEKFWTSADAAYKCINNDADRIKLTK